MLSNVWTSCHASVCQLNFLNERGVCIDSLTGFKVKNFLVTTQHAFCIEKAHKVQITFVEADANTVAASMKIPYAELIKEHRIGVLDNNGHYAIFNIDLPEFEKIPSLTLSEQRNYTIGSTVAALGFNFGYSNLAIKSGLISSVFANADGNRFIQFDGQVSYGNSGSPLIDPSTMQVVGIVSRRNTPASNAYHQLKDIIATNLGELKKVETIVRFGDIDPIQVLVANQNQLKLLANIIYKYSSTSVSQAVTLDGIISFFNEDLSDFDFDIVSKEHKLING
ncbi:S1 family peptidase [Perlabentimonas gracilis]|uniref:S1 family peptidase n=1 Tax=Perlabentimonas gracilis TaxID=2715279 RepID=UPI00140B18D6|nr:serine protease [Perlabentimonas gracilis]NHB70103.1 trypsin-like peptidase domain-containing protein [Perlabentimonas gracilis]